MPSCYIFRKYFMNFYLFFRKLHLYFTLIALAPLAVIAVTGLLLLFEVEITQWQASENKKHDATFVQSEQSMAVLQTHIDQILKEKRPCRVGYIRHDAQFLSLPWIYLTCPEGFKKFVINLNTDEHYPLVKEGFQIIIDLHRTLLLNKVGLGDVGSTIVGIATLVIVFNIVLGLVLWFIRAKKIQVNKQKFKITTASGVSLRHLHSVTALYLTPILLIVAITGVSWTWRDDIYQGLAQLQNKEQAKPVELTQLRSQPYDPITRTRHRMASIKAIYQKIEQDYPSYQILGFGPALRKMDVITVRLKEKTSIGFTPQLYLTLDAYSLEEKYKTDAWQATSTDSLYAYRITQYGLHTGYIFGTLGKWLWAAAILLFIASTLILGVYLWLNRRSKEGASKPKGAL
jgi:uncharacterized iron-regulated membrane protein